MEIEIGWRLLGAVVFTGLVVIAVFRTIYEDNTTTDLQGILNN